VCVLQTLGNLQKAGGGGFNTSQFPFCQMSPPRDPKMNAVLSRVALLLPLLTMLRAVMLNAISVERTRDAAVMIATAAATARCFVIETGTKTHWITSSQRSQDTLITIHPTVGRVPVSSERKRSLVATHFCLFDLFLTSNRAPDVRHWWRYGRKRRHIYVPTQSLATVATAVLIRR